jgi:hypothetical protein
VTASEPARCGPARCSPAGLLPGFLLIRLLSGDGTEGETQGELITKFPGSEAEAVSVPVLYTKADGTTGTDLYLSKDGQAAFAADIPTAAFRVLQAT